MKTCGGCRSGAIVLGVDGLVAVFVLQLMRDVGWQGHLAKLVQNLLEDTFILEADQAVSLVYHIDDFCLQQAAAEVDARAGSGFLSRLYQGLPDIVCLALQKQHFDVRAGVFFDA